ncbi:hypothetical protein [Blautia sp. Marseille-P3087]|uniref:hypothetical protein n=1 Tax=Blautia sp. Marseille-P3087 TaxID=1917876 RepID=UPI0009300FBE|nr:hypothetical protein [Blautia sp. Marseille-P3087]
MNTNIPTITVDPELRELILPSEKLVLGINGDVEVNAVQFQLPLTYRELELKKLTPRINYVNANGDTNYYETVMKSDESNCYFIWPITPDITAYTGHVRFSLTLYQTEGDNILHKFNTRSATGRVYTGFEAEKQVTPEQQQTLLSKLETQIKADLNDHTERLKNELTEKGKEILDGFGESGNVSEELKTIKQDLGTKLTAPPTPEAGKILKIKSVNEDGTFTCEWADGGSNLDVRINGESIVQDGVAEIPISSHDTLGLVYTDNSAGGYTTGLMNQQGRLKVNTASIDDVNKRRLRKEIDCSNFDYAVKAAMCDGKGAAWTAEEQATARERMGIISEDDFELIATVNPSKEEIVSSMLIDLAEPIKANFYIVCNIGITDKSLNYVNIPRLQLTINDYTTWMYQSLQKNSTELRYMLMQIPICKKSGLVILSNPIPINNDFQSGTNLVGNGLGIAPYSDRNYSKGITKINITAKDNYSAGYFSKNTVFTIYGKRI